MNSKLEKLGDVFELLSCGIPKRIIFDLSNDDDTFYNVKIFTDIADKSKNKVYECYIECKSMIDSIKCYPLAYNHEDENERIFTITIPDLDE